MVYCDPRDLWVSLRPVNRQLQECAEQHFEKNILALVELNLPIAIPSYDMRNRIWGKAVFHPDTEESSDKKIAGRVTYSLTSTEPEHYHSHFLGRWKGMWDSGRNGNSHEGMTWELKLVDRIDGARLRKALLHWDRDRELAQVSFQWKATMTRFFE